jgi:hypothetical protein
MKGQPEDLVERAARQARREADLLYMLVVRANVAVLESMVKLHREYVLSLGFLGAVLIGKNPKHQIEELRLAVLLVIEPVILLDAVIAQLVVDRLVGQPVLFRDSAASLLEQLQMVAKLSSWFNETAVDVGSSEINLEELRTSLQTKIDRQIALWVSLARIEMLSAFGKREEMHAEMNQYLKKTRTDCASM